MRLFDQAQRTRDERVRWGLRSAAVDLIAAAFALAGIAPTCRPVIRVHRDRKKILYGLRLLPRYVCGH